MKHTHSSLILGLIGGIGGLFIAAWGATVLLWSPEMNMWVMRGIAVYVASMFAALTLLFIRSKGMIGKLLIPLFLLMGGGISYILYQLAPMFFGVSEGTIELVEQLGMVAPYFGFVILAVLLPLFIYLGWFLYHSFIVRDYVLREGRSAKARIMSSRYSGTKVNGMPLLHLELEVHLPGHSPYHVSTSSVVPQMVLHRLDPGTMVPVKVHPEKKKVVFFELWEWK